MFEADDVVKESIGSSSKTPFLFSSVNVYTSFDFVFSSRLCFAINW